MSATLRLRGVSRSFGGIAAVSDVSFDVPAGTVCALVGPNGAGKTTLFNLMTNVLPLDGGSVLLDERSLTGLSGTAIADLGVIRTFQSARVFPGMTVLENLLAGRHRLLRHGGIAHALRLSAARREQAGLRDRALALLDLVGLRALADAHAASLPMGAQKLLEILRALMARPRVLLLDEPAAGLDDTETAELADLLRAIRAAGVTVLVVEHNMQLVMRVADQMIVLEAGCVIASGPPELVRRNARVIEAYLGTEVAAGC